MRCNFGLIIHFNAASSMTYKKEMMSLKTIIAIYCPLLSTLRGGGGSYLFQVCLHCIRRSDL